MEETAMLNTAILVLLGGALAWLLFSLGKLWIDYIDPAIRDWLYERRMDKARQQFMRDLYRELEEKRK